MSGPDDGPNGAENDGTVPSFPSAPPSFGHRSAEPTAPQQVQGPPPTPWWQQAEAQAQAQALPYDDVLVAGPAFDAANARASVPPPGDSDDAPILEPDAIHPPGTAPTAANPLPLAPLDDEPSLPRPSFDAAASSHLDSAAPVTGLAADQTLLDAAVFTQPQQTQPQQTRPPWGTLAVAAAPEEPPAAPAEPEPAVPEAPAAVAAEEAAEPLPEPEAADASAAPVLTKLDGIPVKPALEAAPRQAALAAPAGAEQTLLDASVPAPAAAGSLDGVLQWGGASASAAGGPTVMDLAAARPPVMMPPSPAFGLPQAPPPPPPAPPVQQHAPKRKKKAAKRAKYAAVALVPALVIAGAAAVVLTRSNSGEAKTVAQPSASVPAVPVPVPTTPAPEPEESAPPVKQKTGSAADSYKTDEKLTLARFFGGKEIKVSAHAFLLDARSLNDRCDYTARGAMVKALKTGNCLGVARATYLTRNKRIGVTVGVVAMPTKAVATKTRAVANPGKLDWFVGLPGKHTKNVMDPDGYATTSSAGRYVLYAYVRYISGPPPAPNDRQLAKVAQGFLIYLNQPLRG
ncbi:hypothetical protein [Actinocorallia longicatena]|uniref:Uncharacterized protein n=1 Tax=Actinocorallia longicatena TaxID=111803 RepID=A0ABP6Q390_9ACTN